MAGIHIREGVGLLGDDDVVCYLGLTNLPRGDDEPGLESKYYYRLERMGELRGRLNLSDLTCRRICREHELLEQGEGVSGQLWLQITAEKDTRGPYSLGDVVLSEPVR